MGLKNHEKEKITEIILKGRGKEFQIGKPTIVLIVMQNANRFCNTNKRIMIPTIEKLNPIVQSYLAE